MSAEFGLLSTLPVICVIILAISTRRAIESILFGSLVGCVLLAKWAFIPTWVAAFFQVFKDDTVAFLSLVVTLFGALIALFEASGALSGFTQFIERFTQTRRRTLMVTWFLGFFIFVDDYLHNLTVGTSMKKLTDRHGVSRAKLAYLVNATAAPLCIILPVSTWAVYFSGLQEHQGLAGGNAMEAYLHTLKYMFYGFITVAVSFLVALEWIPSWGSMKKFEQKRAACQAKLAQTETDAETTETSAAKRSVGIHNFIIPMVLLVAVTLMTEVNIIYGLMAAVTSMLLLYVSQRIMTFSTFMDTFFEGMQSMMPVIALLIIAFTLKEVNLALGLPEYIIR